MTVLKRNPNRIRRGFGSRLFDVINIVLLVLLAREMLAEEKAKKQAAKGA